MKESNKMSLGEKENAEDVTDMVREEAETYFKDAAVVCEKFRASGRRCFSRKKRKAMGINAVSPKVTTIN